MKTKIKGLIFIVCAFMLSINLMVSTRVMAQEIEIMAPAKAMVVIEGNTKDVLYSYNSDNKLAMASTTKIATAIVAIENCNDLDSKFVVSDKSIGIEGTSIYLKKGEVLSMRELLYGLILAIISFVAIPVELKSSPIP